MISDPVPLAGVLNRWRVQEIETHCPVHCPGCGDCRRSAGLTVRICTHKDCGHWESSVVAHAGHCLRPGCPNQASACPVHRTKGGTQ